MDDRIQPGTTFWDVEDLPVTVSPSGLAAWAWDSNPPRLFSVESVWRNGGEVTEARFRQLIELKAQRFAAMRKLRESES